MWASPDPSSSRMLYLLPEQILGQWTNHRLAQVDQERPVLARSFITANVVKIVKATVID